MQTKYGKAGINSEGYYTIHSTKEGNHGKKLHRLIFEEFYQITLPSNIVIHHCDHNKLNNNIWNLIPMTREEHTAYHSQFLEFSEETRAKMSKAHKGKKLSETHIQMLKERFSGKGNPNYGKKTSKETKQKISDKTRKYKFCGQNVYFKKNLASADSPRRCFEMRYERYTLPIGWFNEWVSCEIIHNLIEEAIS